MNKEKDKEKDEKIDEETSDSHIIIIFLISMIIGLTIQTVLMVAFDYVLFDNIITIIGFGVLIGGIVINPILWTFYLRFVKNLKKKS